MVSEERGGGQTAFLGWQLVICNIVGTNGMAKAVKGWQGREAKG